VRNATRTIVSTLGVFIGIGGIDHGFLETLHGNIPTSGFMINALGEGNNWTLWKQGGEGAFTVIPNFLLTGIVSIIVSLLIIIWSIGFIHRKEGSQLFLLLGFLLFLVGGGVAQVLFIILAWAVSTRINKPLTWWRKILTKNIRGTIAKLWLGSLIVFSLLFFTALEIAIFGFVPGVNNPELILHICWSILGSALGILLLTFVSGFAYDIERQTNIVV
jgi:hypothetical protein